MASLRKSTIRVTDVAGVVWEGDGASMAQAVRDLGRRHHAGRPVAVPVAEAAVQDAGDDSPGWRVTPKGRRALALARLFGTIPDGNDGDVAGVADGEGRS